MKYMAEALCPLHAPSRYLPLATEWGQSTPPSISLLSELVELCYHRRIRYDVGCVPENVGTVGITEANLSLLKSGKVKGVRFSTLEKICEALECQPGDLLEYRKGA